MAENCNQKCGSCKERCNDRKEPMDLKVKLNENSTVRKVIAVVSGKGGVGKSLVTSLMATAMTRRGYKSAILDADVTGPSIPKAFGITGKALADEGGLFPMRSKGGVEIMSVNLLLEDDADPVVWRGPVIAGVVKQFWTDVQWGAVDFMFVDLPPGTGDVPLTVFQSLPVDGIIVVTSPQELVSMIVAKAVRMARMMDVPILGLVENLSYFRCPDNGKDYHVFGESHLDEIASEYLLPVMGKLPIDPAIAAACDRGLVETCDTDPLDALADRLAKLLEE